MVKFQGALLFMCAIPVAALAGASRAWAGPVCEFTEEEYRDGAAGTDVCQLIDAYTWKCDLLQGTGEDDDLAYHFEAGGGPIPYYNVSPGPSPTAEAYINGGDGSDHMKGSEDTHTHDHIWGEGGDDTLWGLNGNGYLEGGPGDDDIKAGAGDDVSVFGNDGTDTICGGNGIDQLQGGGQNDILIGESGTDSLYGEGGSDTCETGGLGEIVSCEATAALTCPF